MKTFAIIAGIILTLSFVGWIVIRACSPLDISIDFDTDEPLL